MPRLHHRLQLQLLPFVEVDEYSRRVKRSGVQQHQQQQQQQLIYLQQSDSRNLQLTVLPSSHINYRNSNNNNHSNSYTNSNNNSKTNYARYCCAQRRVCDSKHKSAQRLRAVQQPLSSYYFSGLIMTVVMLAQLLCTAHSLHALAPLLLLSLSARSTSLPLFDNFDSNRIQFNYAALPPIIAKRSSDGDSSSSDSASALSANFFDSQLLQQLRAVPSARVERRSAQDAAPTAATADNDRRSSSGGSSVSAPTFHYDLQPKGCSSLTLDPPTLSFVEEEQPRVILNRNSTPDLGCRRVFECKVLSSPPEANIFWYRNGKVVKATALRDPTLANAQDSLSSISIAAAERDDVGAPLAADDGADAAATFEPLAPMIGLSQMTHRICLDPYVEADRANAFKCKIQSVCEPERTIESEEIVVEPYGALRPLLRTLANKSDNKRNIVKNIKENRADAAAAENTLATSAARPWSGAASMKRKRRILNAAPLITMITSTRMELAGRDVQIACHAAGAPKPRIMWSVIDDENEEISYPVSGFSFINEMANGDLIVESSQTDLASVTLKCEASNPFGTDSDTSTLILLNG